MKMDFALLDGPEGPYMVGIEVVEEPAAPMPEIPPPCWDDRTIDAGACWRATKALCG